MINSMELGENIKAARVAAGLSIGQAANLLRLSRETYMDIEGRGDKVSMELFVMIADLFDVSADWLLARKPAPDVSSIRGRIKGTIEDLRRLTELIHMLPDPTPPVDRSSAAAGAPGYSDDGGPGLFNYDPKTGSLERVGPPFGPLEPLTPENADRLKEWPPSIIPAPGAEKPHPIKQGHIMAINPVYTWHDLALMALSIINAMRPFPPADTPERVALDDSERGFRAAFDQVNSRLADFQPVQARHSWEVLAERAAQLLKNAQADLWELSRMADDGKIWRIDRGRWLDMYNAMQIWGPGTLVNHNADMRRGVDEFHKKLASALSINPAEFDTSILIHAAHVLSFHSRGKGRRMMLAYLKGVTDS